MKIILMIISVLLIPLFAISCGTVTNVNEYISSVHDGDTFRDSNNVQYRLYGVDTAEMSNQYDGFKTTTGIEQIYAYEATELTKKLILKKNVKVIIKATDRYGRRVARIISNGVDLSLALIKAGLARVSYIDVIPGSIYETKDYVFYKKLLREQKRARDLKKGFWLHEKDFSTIFPKA